MLLISKLASRSFLVFGLYAALGVFIIVLGIGSYDLAKETGRDNTQTSNGDLALTPLRAPANMNVADMPTLLISNVSADSHHEVARTSSYGVNTTNSIVQMISQEILAKNPDGPGPDPRLAVPKAEEVVNNILAKGIKDFDYETLKPQVTDGDIKITRNADKAALSDYVHAFFAIFSKTSGAEDAIGADPTNPLESAGTLADVYGGYEKDLRALPVPEELVAFHKRMIALMAANKKIFDIVAAYESDPMKTVLALQALGATKNELAQLYSEIALFAAKKNIAIF